MLLQITFDSTISRTRDIRNLNERVNIEKRLNQKQMQILIQINQNVMSFYPNVQCLTSPTSEIFPSQQEIIGSMSILCVFVPKRSVRKIKEKCVE